MTDVTERGDFARTLAESGYTDVLVISCETGERLLTSRRRELIDHLRRHEPESDRDIAAALDRDLAMVSKDLDLLFTHDVIEYDGEDRSPRLKHSHVVIEPII